MQERAVVPDRIDGGFEFNGWYTSPCYPRDGAPATNRFERAWWVVRDDYRLFWSRRTVDNTRYAVVRDLPWTSWLRLEHRALALAARRDERSIPPWDFAASQDKDEEGAKGQDSEMTGARATKVPETGP